MIRVAVTGAAGRMGKTLVQAVDSTADLSLGAAFEQAGLSLIGADAGELAGVGSLGVALEEDIVPACARFDVLIDFSVPDATLASVRACRAAGKPMVIGTTGFDDSGLAQIQDAATEVPIVMAPNMSVGVNVTFKLVELAARVLGDEVDVEVIEAHHRDKVDAPSGTALRIGEILAETLERDLATDAVYGREGITGPRERRTIGFETIRGGDIVGEHTVMFAGSGERIEIIHRAQSRMNFAHGALRAVRFVTEQDCGLFDMQDVLGLKGPFG